MSVLGELTLYLTFNYLGLCLTLRPDCELLEMEAAFVCRAVMVGDKRLYLFPDQTLTVWLMKHTQSS